MLDIATSMERGFTGLTSLPTVNANDAARQQMLEEAVSSDVLGTYLVMSNTPFAAPRVTVLHSAASYSAGFGGAPYRVGFWDSWERWTVINSPR
jgi:hypothetical protein